MVSGRRDLLAQAQLEEALREAVEDGTVGFRRERLCWWGSMG